MGMTEVVKSFISGEIRMTKNKKGWMKILLRWKTSTSLLQLSVCSFIENDVSYQNSQVTPRHCQWMVLHLRLCCLTWHPESLTRSLWLLSRGRGRVNLDLTASPQVKYTHTHIRNAKNRFVGHNSIRHYIITMIWCCSVALYLTNLQC